MIKWEDRGWSYKTSECGNYHMAMFLIYHSLYIVKGSFHNELYDEYYRNEPGSQLNTKTTIKVYYLDNESPN
jgi:hypothetical protein